MIEFLSAKIESNQQELQKFCWAFFEKNAVAWVKYAIENSEKLDNFWDHLFFLIVLENLRWKFEKVSFF